MTRVCPKCNSPLEPKARFCPKDGTPAEECVEVPIAADETAAAPENIVIEPERGQRRVTGATKPFRPDLRDLDTTLINKLIDGRYRIQSRIGDGGIGVVYRAQHVKLHRPVAVKVLHKILAGKEEFRLRFEREALAASKLNHPSCVSVTDFGTFENRCFLVMEFVEGQILSELIAGGPLPPQEAVLITEQVLSALAHAHGLGIIHRDIKPGNIMLCEPDRAGTSVKLLDFGLAKNLVMGEPGSSPLTQFGTVFGTPGYISPEQASGIPADARSDLYSLGVVLFCMVCGRRPFESEDPLEMIDGHLNTPPPPAREHAPGVSAKLESVILRAMEKDREQRYQSAEAFISALRRVPEYNEPVTAGAGDGSASQTRREPPAHPYGSFRGLSLRMQDWWLISSTGTKLALILGAVALVGAIIAGAVVCSISDGEEDDLEGLGMVIERRKDPVPPSLAPKRKTSKRNEKAPEDPPKLPSAPPPEPPDLKEIERARKSPELRWARANLKAGQLGRAEDQARRAIRKNRRAGEPHLVLGHILFQKLWFSDAVKEYTKAVSLDPSLKSDPLMLNNAIHCLSRRSSSGKALYLLVKRIGDPARSALENAARKYRNQDVRRRAKWALEQLDR